MKSSCGEVALPRQEHFGKTSERNLPALSEAAPSQESPPKSPEEAPPPAEEIRRLMDLEPPRKGPKRKKGHQPGRKSPGRTRHTDLPGLPEGHTPDCTTCEICQAPSKPYGSPETSEIIEQEVRAYRRIVRRIRHKKTCACAETPKIVTAPPAPRLIPKGKLGISVWTTIPIDKYAGCRPTARLLKDFASQGLPLSQGTITDGLKHLAGLVEPLYEGIVERGRQAPFAHADETRTYVRGDKEGTEKPGGKNPDRWWLRVFLTLDTVLFVVDPTRSGQGPLRHFLGRICTAMVDRYSAYKFVEERIVGFTRAFCWAPMRRDFIRAFVKHPNQKKWTLVWVVRIRTLYHLGKKPEDRVKNKEALIAHLDVPETGGRKRLGRQDSSRTVPKGREESRHPLDRIRSLPPASRHSGGLHCVRARPSPPGHGPQERHRSRGSSCPPTSPPGSAPSSRHGGRTESLFAPPSPTPSPSARNGGGEGPRRHLSRTPLVHGCRPESRSLPSSLKRHQLTGPSPPSSPSMSSSRQADHPSWPSVCANAWETFSGPRLRRFFPENILPLYLQGTIECVLDLLQSLFDQDARQPSSFMPGKDSALRKRGSMPTSTSKSIPPGMKIEGRTSSNDFRDDKRSETRSKSGVVEGRFEE